MKKFDFDTKLFSIRVSFSRKDSLIRKIEFIDFYRKSPLITPAGKINSLLNKIEAFSKGERPSFNMKIFDFSGLTDFTKSVLDELLTLKVGEVITYKELAIRVNCPNGARAVGNVLRKNPFPLVIPCHRVVKNNYGIGNYQGGSSLKQKLLLDEGVEIINGKVINKSGV